MDTLQPSPTPMAHHDVKLSIDEKKANMQQYPFRSAISSLMFAMVVTRPDISSAVTSVSRFTANPGMSHWEAILRIFRYLKETSEMKYP